MNNDNLERLNASLLETLSLLILSKEVIDNVCDSEIEIQIEELEGDYYTFFHKDNVMKLLKANRISLNSAKAIENLRIAIANLNPAFWNPKDFIESSSWKGIRSEATLLYEELVGPR